jgi:hypothetical protein
MISVAADAGEVKPIATAAAASCRNLNAHVTAQPLSLLAAAGPPLLYFLYKRLGIARIPLHFATGRPDQTIDGQPGVGNS